MQKNAWTYTMAGTVFAAAAVMLRWLQVQTIFDPETGLPALHAPITTLLVAVLVLVAAALAMAAEQPGACLPVGK